MREINEMKQDKRKKYIVVLDVETAGDVEKNPLVYDLGFVITDKKGVIYERHSYLVKEIFRDKELMNTAYYHEKVPMYLEGLEKGEYTEKTFLGARHELVEAMKRWNIKQVSAYNLNFDLKALQNTLIYLNRPLKNFFKNKVFESVKYVDVWALACQTIYIQKGYREFCVEYGFYSPFGNYRTSAEVGYSYIKNKPNFIESHTGLDDCIIEAEILAHAYRQRKKIHNAFSKSSEYTWQFVTNYHGKVTN